MCSFTLIILETHILDSYLLKKSACISTMHKRTVKSVETDFLLCQNQANEQTNLELYSLFRFPRGSDPCCKWQGGAYNLLVFKLSSQCAELFSQ